MSSPDPSLFFPGRSFFGEFRTARLCRERGLPEFLPGGFLAPVDFSRHCFKIIEK